MICDICHKEYVKSCVHCSVRVKTWGVEGTCRLYEMAEMETDIDIAELVAFVKQYYLGTVTRGYEKVEVLKTSLKLAGYKGNFTGRHGIDKNDYRKYKYAQDASGKRWRLRNEVCDFCAETEGLLLHHIVPTSWGGITSVENCITVCERHHRIIHRELRKSLNRMKLLEYIKPYQEEINEMANKSLDIILKGCE